MWAVKSCCSQKVYKKQQRKQSEFQQKSPLIPHNNGQKQKSDKSDSKGFLAVYFSSSEPRKPSPLTPTKQTLCLCCFLMNLIIKCHCIVNKVNTSSVHNQVFRLISSLSLLCKSVFTINPRLLSSSFRSL